MATTLTWTAPPSVIVKGLESYKRRLMQGVYAVATLFARLVRSYAQTNARWQDQTGAARRGLTAVVIRTATAVTIFLAHSVFYGRYLELSNQGRFAIILEALERHYQPLMQALRRLVGGR